MQIRTLTEADRGLLLSVAQGIFDRTPEPELVDEFLADPRHHMVAAIADDAIVGFVSAVHYIHPDKRAELWINEVAVAPEFRGQGIGRRLIAEVLDLARQIGCVEAWTLTEEGNRPARALYAAVGGNESTPVMVEFPPSQVP